MCRKKRQRGGNAHHLRELKALVDIDKEQWAGQMRDLLVEANATVRSVVVEGAATLPTPVLRTLIKRYNAIVRRGLAFHRNLPPLAHLMAIEKAPKHRGRKTLTAIGDQAFLYFQQRHVRSAANETEQIVAMGLDTTRTTISPRRSRRDLAFGFEACHPAHGAGDADPKTLGCRVARHAAFHHCAAAKGDRN